MLLSLDSRVGLIELVLWEVQKDLSCHVMVSKIGTAVTVSSLFDCGPILLLSLSLGCPSLG